MRRLNVSFFSYSSVKLIFSSLLSCGLFSFLNVLPYYFRSLAEGDGNQIFFSKILALLLFPLPWGLWLIFFLSERCLLLLCFSNRGEEGNYLFFSETLSRLPFLHSLNWEWLIFFLSESGRLLHFFSTRGARVIRFSFLRLLHFCFYLFQEIWLIFSLS